MSAPGSLDGKVAFIIGGARGQGRSHAQLFAEQGADIVTIDLLDDVATVGYPGATQADLDETVRLVEKAGRRIVALQGDVRRQADVDAVVTEGLNEFGHLDIVVANAGITTLGLTWELSEDTWQTMLDVNLTGVFHTVKAAVPAIIQAGNGGAIAMIGSCAIGMQHLGHYGAAKNGVVGLMRSLAAELASYKIRVNLVHPTTVSTEMFLNETSYRVFRPDLAKPPEGGPVGPHDLDEQARRAMDRPDRHQQRPAVPGLRRLSVRHRPGPARRRRRSAAVTGRIHPGRKGTTHA